MTIWREPGPRAGEALAHLCEGRTHGALAHFARVHALPIVLAVGVGVLGTLLVQSKDAAATALAKAAQLERDLRTATGKLYDMQERNEDAQSAEVAAAYVKLYEAQTALEACRKGKQ